MYANICIHCVYIHTYIHTYVCMYVCMQVWVCLYSHTNTYIGVTSVGMLIILYYVLLYVCLCICVCLCVCECVCVNIYLCMLVLVGLCNTINIMQKVCVHCTLYTYNVQCTTIYHYTLMNIHDTLILYRSTYVVYVW